VKTKSESLKIQPQSQHQSNKFMPQLQQRLRQHQRRRSPTPGADSFVKIGDTVKEGQTLCIIEAMKLLNEIESDKSGVVKEILCENGQGVEFGQALFIIG
jgi:biotin carboxyl carrier protein